MQPLHHLVAGTLRWLLTDTQLSEVGSASGAKRKPSKIQAKDSDIFVHEARLQGREWRQHLLPVMVVLLVCFEKGSLVAQTSFEPTI